MMIKNNYLKIEKKMKNKTSTMFNVVFTIGLIILLLSCDTDKMEKRQYFVCDCEEKEQVKLFIQSCLENQPNKVDDYYGMDQAVDGLYQKGVILTCEKRTFYFYNGEIDWKNEKQQALSDCETVTTRYLR